MEWKMINKGLEIGIGLNIYRQGIKYTLEMDYKYI